MQGVDEFAEAAAARLGDGGGFAEALARLLPLADLLSQHDRLLELDCALPGGTLIPRRARIAEAVNAPFLIELHALSPSAELDVAGLIGSQVSLRLLQADGSRRAWHAYVLEAAGLGADGGLAAYRFRLGSWLDFLRLRRDSFVFQDKTALQIVEEVFADLPCANWRVAVTDTLRTRSLCIQYRESDFDFVTRLLAEEGLSYHFEHADSVNLANGGAKAGHCLVIQDGTAARDSIGAVRFAGNRDTAERGVRVDTITRFAAAAAARTNAIARGSWDYQRVAGVSASDDSASAAPNVPRLEHYDGSGAYRYESGDHAARAARLALQAHEQQMRRFEAQGQVRAMLPGRSFVLVEHASLDDAYLVLGVEHDIVNNLGSRASRVMADPALEHGIYRNRLQAQPADVPVLPHAARRPTAPGLQTAVVVGLDGEAQTTERDLRVKLQFHWQRGATPNAGGLGHDTNSVDAQGNAPGNEASGTWVRVSQRAAGANWGEVFVPRIGTEVLVDFVEGDIDRPMVVGQLYNGADTPPFAAGVDSGVNHAGVISGVHSPTLDGSGFNEWTIDDSTGQLRMRLLTSYANTELGLGHLVQQAAAQAQRGATRGAGFELNTQGWGSVRAAQGLMVSTTSRPGTYGSAESTQMDAAEAVARLNAAHELAERLNDVAQTMKAQGLNAHAKSVPDLIASIDPHQQGKFDGSVNGHEAKKADDSGQLTDAVERPSQPTVTLDTPSAFAAISEGPIASFAGQDQAWVAQGDWHDTAAHTMSIVAGQTASWYAHDNGIQAKAAHGPVSLRAHTDKLEILADSHVQVASVNGEITIQAKSRIELVGGDSSITLDGSNITFKTPGTFTVKAATHAWEGAAGSAANVPPLPAGAIGMRPSSVQLDHRYHDDEGVANAAYELLLSDGSKRTGKLDANGRASVDGLIAHPVEVRFGPSQRPYKRKDDTPMPNHDPAPSDSKLAALVDRYAAGLIGGTEA